MAKRLQISLPDREYREIQRAARARRMSIAEWVRQALDMACQREPSKSLHKKLEGIRTAARYEFPVSDIEELRGEIEMGYGSSDLV